MNSDSEPRFGRQDAAAELDEYLWCVTRPDEYAPDNLTDEEVDEINANLPPF